MASQIVIDAQTNPAISSIEGETAFYLIFWPAIALFKTKSNKFWLSWWAEEHKPRLTSIVY